MTTFIFYALAAVLVLGFLIFFHELGHFLVAKACGVSVLKFSLGFGPRLAGMRVGETEYAISLVPLGGYVKMLGEEEEGGDAPAGDPARSFANQPLWKRFAIVFAGPFFNLTSSWVCLLIVILAYGMLVPSDLAKVGGVMHGLPAEKAGLSPNDLILSVNGESLSTWDQLVERTMGSKGSPMALKVKRGESTLDVTVVPEKQVNTNIFGETVGEAFRIGIERAAEEKNPKAIEAPWIAAQQVFVYSELIVLSLVKMVQGKVSARELGGPITIARIAGERAQTGIKSLLEFVAFLGVNLGVLNLLPIPVLDGGHLFFFAAEGLFRRPVGLRVREVAQQVGLVLLVSLMLFAVYNDIYRWIQG
jgi:regulator of sigma E protease